MSSDRISRARAQFGPAADAYANSDVHARGESLGLLLKTLGLDGSLSDRPGPDDAGPESSGLDGPGPGDPGVGGRGMGGSSLGDAGVVAAGGRDRLLQGEATSDPTSPTESATAAASYSRAAALDIGTGAGHTAIAVAAHVHRVMATDVTEEMLAKTCDRAAAAGRSNVETAEARAEELPFSDGEFDLVTCRLAFHHFEDQPKAAAEMARVLRHGGQLGLTDNVTVQANAAAEYYNGYERLRDPSHVRVLSSADLVRVLEGAGFVVYTFQRLSKEFEFHEWADRQRVGDEEKVQLLDMMRNIPTALEPLLKPRWADGTMYFSLWEAVVTAVKP